jgi:hypothetical protein
MAEALLLFTDDQKIKKRTAQEKEELLFSD